MTTATRPKVRWFVWAGSERLPHNRTMAGTWGWDVECECGWGSRTGGATRRSVQRDLNLHRHTPHAAPGAGAGAEGLDVERLREAIHIVYGPIEAKEDTEAIAAEYARLARR